MDAYAYVCVPVQVSHHILIFALDFVCSPGLPVITVGYFVRLDVLWAADTLCTLGNQARDPHSPLQVYLWSRKKPRQVQDEILALFSDTVYRGASPCEHACPRVQFTPLYLFFQGHPSYSKSLCPNRTFNQLYTPYPVCPHCANCQYGASVKQLGEPRGKRGTKKEENDE